MLSGYTAFEKLYDFKIILTAKIAGDDTCEFSIKAENEIGYNIQAVYFPAPFNSKKMQLLLSHRPNAFFAFMPPALFVPNKS